MQPMVEQQIRNFIIETFLFGESSNGLKDTDSLLETGVIDSTGVLELIAFLEETYKVKVKDEELVPENLDSIVNVSDFIRRKQAEV
ncbi:MAG: acyl carrier protein [Candidatus Zixiibacteriota bacterium]